MDLKETLREAVRKCGQIEFAAKYAEPQERELLSEMHEHYEKIARIAARHTQDRQ